MIERLKISEAWGQCYEQLRLSGNIPLCSTIGQNVYQHEIMYENSTLIILYERVEEGRLRQGGYFWLHITGNTRIIPHKFKYSFKQECILVGCVPPAH